MRRITRTMRGVLALLAAGWWEVPAWGGELLEMLPSTDIVMDGSAASVEIRLGEEVVPSELFVLVNGEKKQLPPASSFTYTPQEAGDFVFAAAAPPLWDEKKQKVVTRYVKVVINAFGAGPKRMWDEPVRFPLEIDPLVRPYGLWTCNSFRGHVKQNGRTLPFADVLAVYGGAAEIDFPAQPFRVQTLVADINGVFTYTMPRSGWWGFAAVSEAEMVERGGALVEAEEMGIIWVRCMDMTVKKDFVEKR